MFNKRTTSVRGQGLVEYALILVLMVVVIIVIISLTTGGPKKTPGDAYTDDFVKRTYALTEKVDVQDLVIEHRVNDGSKNYVFRLKHVPSDKIGVLWCEVLSATEGSCRPYELTKPR